RQQRLTDAVVDLVRAGVVEILALQVDARAPTAVDGAGQFLDQREARRAIDVVGEELVEFGDERRIGLRRARGGVQRVERRHYRLGDVASAKGSKVSYLR